MLWCAQQHTHRQAAILPTSIQIKARNAMTHTTAFSLFFTFLLQIIVYACCGNKFRSRGREGWSTKLFFFVSLGFCELFCPPLAISYRLASLFTASQKCPLRVWRGRQTQKVSAWLHFPIERNFALKENSLRYHPSTPAMRNCTQSFQCLSVFTWFLSFSLVDHHKNSPLF